jgi:thiosulfate/3-mercaptopyruvate sulfurtransferase
MIKKILIILILFVNIFPSLAQEPIIVTPAWLHQHLNDPGRVVLYTGFVIRSDFEREHIEGSRFLWPDWLAPDTPEGNMNATPPKAATKVLQELGINKASKIVICHKGTDLTIAARMFMTLENLGLEGRVSFLSGGIEAWKRAGFPVTDQPSSFKKGNFTATNSRIIVDKNYVLKSLQDKSSYVVDARAKRFYDGDPTGNPRDGHITGALNIPYQDMTDSLINFKTSDQLELNFGKVIPVKDKELVVYCFIGQTACVDYIAGRSLGYHMKIYDGSIQEWSRDPKFPMEKIKKE